jgi:hypothetical protein
MNGLSFRRWVSLSAAGALLLALVLPVTAASAATSSKTVAASATNTVIALVPKDVTNTLAVPAQYPWTDTKIHLSVGDDLLLKASGTINVSSGNPQFDNTPAGQGPADPQCIGNSDTPWGDDWIAEGLPCWSLIGRIGNGTPFFVGSEYLSVVKQPGELYLGVNDQKGAFGDNSGSWTVRAILATSIPPPSGNIYDQFNKWLRACIDGQLASIDPGCRQAAIDLAGVNPKDILNCLADISNPYALVFCAGEKAAYGIYLILLWWLTNGKPGP